MLCIRCSGFCPGLKTGTWNLCYRRRNPDPPYLYQRYSCKLVDENTFEITADFEPGEYAFIFKPAKLGEFDFTSIYGFYVAE
ncbi:MAG: hypothetical protein KBT05_07275 [Bacteroidales bacterium]|nr:hypothetical protein [Candidatus Cryptobacteroides caccocaballi]